MGKATLGPGLPQVDEPPLGGNPGSEAPLGGRKHGYTPAGE